MEGDIVAFLSKKNTKESDIPMKDEANRIDIDKFLAYAKEKKSAGKTAKQIAQSLGLSTTKFKDLLRRAKELKRREAA